MSKSIAEALRRIETCHKDAQIALNLCGLQLAALPLEIGQLTTLAALNIYGNKLTALPPEIGRFATLTALDLGDNGLIALPPEIGQLTALTALHLYSNQLTALPPEIGQLAALTELDISSNGLTALPSEIGQLAALTALNIYGNKLTVLPPEIGQLAALTELHLSGNELAVLPPEIGQLAALTELHLRSNRLTTLPSEIGQLTALTALHLYSNQLTALPPEIGQLAALTELDISSNGLTALPSEISQLAALTELDLNGNKLAALPPEIGQLATLTKLHLRSNRLTVLPPEIGQLATLTKLNLGGNELAVLLPEIGQLAALTELDLDGNKLAALPPEIGQLATLTKLDLNGNKLAALPPEIGQLATLTELHLRSNRLTTLPPEIGQLATLTELDLDGNKLAALPPEIGQLATLTKLHLRSNRLTTLPPEIGQLATLTKLNLGGNELAVLPRVIGQLAALTTLNLYGNKLAALLPEIGQLAALTTLDLGDNKLTALPPEIGQLATLTTLDLRGNRLTVLPREIGQLAALTELYLGGNRLTVLPREIGQLAALTTLDLGDNELAALPPEIGQLTALTALNLGGNSDLGIPPEVLHSAPGAGKGARSQEIIAWYLRNRAAKAKRRILEAKVILVGWGAVGKTSLRRRLLEGTFDEQEDTTQKIEIHPWDVTLGTDSAKLHVWDFGGQEIMHATHQFFLTKRSLYVLVLAGREKTQGANDAEYWLRLIKSFGDGSPAIVVLNKQLKHPFDLDRRSLRVKYPFIQQFIETDCEPPLRLGELRSLILDQVDKLPDLRAEFDANWMAIKDKVTALKDQGRKRITVAEYVDLCRQNAEPEDRWQKWLLRFLHDLGVVVCFHDDHRLADDGVLDPQWVVDGVYKVLNEKSLKGGDGLVSRKQIRALLPANEYTDTDVRIILDLMDKFQLCFWLNENRADVVVPELMTEQGPDWATMFPDLEPGLRFELKYDFLPEGLVPRFIVATHDISRVGERWRSGVILRNKKGNAALVRGDATGSPPRVHIVVNGPVATRRELLAIIRRDFEKINMSIPGLEVKERVPIAGYNVEPVNYDDLVTAEAMGEKTWNIVADGSFVKLPFSQLLDGIEPKPKRQARAKGSKLGMVINGDYIEGDKNVQEKNYTNTGTNQGIIGDNNQQTITNIFKHCADPTAAERELTQLKQFLAELLPKLPEDKRAEAEIHGEALEESAKKNDPKSRAKYGISAKGLLEAAKWVKDFSGNLGGSLLNLGKAIWPDYSLPT